MEFEAYPKIKRASANNMIITEKLDGTNAQVAIDEHGNIKFGSRSRWVTPGKDTDNYGFAAWAEEHRDELLTLGPGRHYGEWWGKGIQRGYGMDTRRFSLFNTFRPLDTLPGCVSVVPVLYTGEVTATAAQDAMDSLRLCGSVVAPEFMDPEGIVVYYHLTRMRIKMTFGGDTHKGAK